MASNKEYLIAVLDVRPCANDDFKIKSVKCVEELLKSKICAGAKDYISFVLVGTEQTKNDVNAQVFPDCYENITQYPETQIPSWQLLINFFKFVNETVCDDGDWLEALVVAMEMIKKSENMKQTRSRILLFYDFNDAPTSFDMYDVISANIAQSEVELIVVSQNIMYIDNPISGEPKSIFCDGKKSKLQLKNEDYALRLVTDSNAKLFNFEEANRRIFKVFNKRPWTWNNTLAIGSKIRLNITGVIVMKDESNIKLKKCWGQADELVSRELKSFVRGAEIEPSATELIDAYMLGSTPVPYDESLLEDEKPKYEPGLKFVGFMKRQTVPEEYFCGDSLYWIVHQKGMNASAQQLDALVRAMIKLDMIMLCCKVYNKAFNTPRMVVLLPNKLNPDRPASLTMVEIAYHSQYQFFQFPRLCTPKTECTQKQIDAIDNLIDAMDLSLNPKECDGPRETLEPDLLPFDTLPHIFEKNVMDVLERKVISNFSDDDEQFAEMLEDKNFVEVFWKVPELRENRAKRAANEIKRLFPLEYNMTAQEKSAATKAGIKSENGDNSSKTTTISTSASSATTLDFERVREATPATDFRQLLEHNVLTLKNRTERDTKFHSYAKQIRDVIWQLLFESDATTKEQQTKVREAMQIYREQCIEFNAYDDYNKWIADVKAAVSEKQLQTFWQQVVVAHELGLCFVSNDTVESKRSLEKFYELE